MSQYYSKRPLKQAQPVPRQMDFDDAETEDDEQLRQQAKRQAYRQPEEPSGKLTPRSAYRYQPADLLDEIIERGDAIPMPDGVMYVDRQNNVGYYAHTGAAPVPARASRRVVQLPQRAASIERETEPQQLVQTRRAKRPPLRVHRLFFVGLALFVMILG